MRTDARAKDDPRSVASADPRGRWTAWAVTWVSYAVYYFGRKSLSVAKSTIVADLGPRTLDGVETIYLAAYAAGQYGSGWMGDRIGPRRLVGVGMLVSAAACFAFGMSSTGALFLATAFVNGLAQSTGWPGNIKAMQEWTVPTTRGRVMGIWTTCYQVGPIAAASLASWMLRDGWRAAFFAPATVLLASAVGVLALLRRGPGHAAQSVAPEQTQAVRRAVASSPILWCYGGSYFFIKLIRYSLFYWLPFYLSTALHYAPTRAGFLSNAFEIGGVAGTVGLGWLSDRVNFSRSALSACSLVGLALALLAYERFGALGPAVNFSVMACVGALLYGPDALLSGAAAQDLGGASAAALASGMINGCGSVGAVLEEVVMRTVSRLWGWNAAFWVLFAAALAAAVCLVPTWRHAERPS